MFCPFTLAPTQASSCAPLAYPMPRTVFTRWKSKMSSWESWKAVHSRSNESRSLA